MNDSVIKWNEGKKTATTTTTTTTNKKKRAAYFNCFRANIYGSFRYSVFVYTHFGCNTVATLTHTSSTCTKEIHHSQNPCFVMPIGYSQFWDDCAYYRLPRQMIFNWVISARVQNFETKSTNCSYSIRMQMWFVFFLCAGFLFRMYIGLKTCAMLNTWMCREHKQ